MVHVANTNALKKIGMTDSVTQMLTVHAGACRSTAELAETREQIKRDDMEQNQKQTQKYMHNIF